MTTQEAGRLAHAPHREAVLAMARRLRAETGQPRLAMFEPAELVLTKAQIVG